MRITYDPGLVEEIVFLLAGADEARWRERLRRINPLYECDDHDRAIPEAALGLFRDWGMARLCEEALAPAAAVGQGLVVRSHRPGDEGADLLVGDERSVILRLAPPRFLEPDALRRFLRHEMQHVVDMLDPGFGYRPELKASGDTHAERELVRGRYRVLWDVAIDVVAPSPVAPELRELQVARAFSALDEEKRVRLVGLVRDPANRKHATLAAAARDPWEALGEERSTLPTAGQPCPLCGFPTHAWDDAPPADAILCDFPDWNESSGACRQCADIYRQPRDRT